MVEVSANTKEFQANLRKRARQVRQGSNRVKKQMARSLFRNLVRFTPVDTTLHRSMWTAGLNGAAKAAGIPLGLKPPAGRKGLGRVREKTSAVQVNAAGMDVINKAKIGDVIVLSNSGPAILELERGRSRQAPQGIVTPAMVRARRQGLRTKLFTEGTKAGVRGQFSFGFPSKV